MGKIGMVGAGFNLVAGTLESVRKNIPREVKIFLVAICKQFELANIKSSVLKPVALMEDVAKYFEVTFSAPITMVIDNAKSAKTLIGGFEFVGKLPEIGRVISTPISTKAPEAPLEVHQGRVFKIAHMAIHLADAAVTLNKYNPIPKTLAGALPHVYSIAGGYMGYAGLQDIWEKRKQGVDLINTAYSGAFFAQSLLGVAGRLVLDKNSHTAKWFQKAGTYVTIATVVIPVIKSVRDAYRAEEKRRNDVEGKEKQSNKSETKKEESTSTPTPPTNNNETKEEEKRLIMASVKALASNYFLSERQREFFRGVELGARWALVISGRPSSLVADKIIDYMQGVQESFCFPLAVLSLKDLGKEGWSALPGVLSYFFECSLVIIKVYYENKVSFLPQIEIFEDSANIVASSIDAIKAFKNVNTMFSTSADYVSVIQATGSLGISIISFSSTYIPQLKWLRRGVLLVETTVFVAKFAHYYFEHRNDTAD